MIAAWKAEHKAFSHALKAMNPNLPALSQTASGGLLTDAMAFIAAAKQAGYAAHGHVDLDHPEVVSLKPQPKARTAVVEACTKGGLILVDPKTGKPVPGPSGEVSWGLEHTTLTYAAGIGWLAQKNDVHSGKTRAAACGGR